MNPKVVPCLKEKDDLWPHRLIGELSVRVGINVVGGFGLGSSSCVRSPKFKWVCLEGQTHKTKKCDPCFCNKDDLWPHRPVGVNVGIIKRVCQPTSIHMFSTNPMKNFSSNEVPHQNTPFICCSSGSLYHILQPAVAPPVKKLFPHPLVETLANKQP